jgi:hypothetical protein
MDHSEPVMGPPMPVGPRSSRIKIIADILRVQSRQLGFIIVVQAYLVASTQISDSVLSSRISGASVIVPLAAAACSGLVTAIATFCIIGLAVASKLERYLPDFFAVCALVAPFVGFMIVLEKGAFAKGLGSRVVDHISIFVWSALLSFLSWWMLSMAAFGALRLLGDG